MNISLDPTRPELAGAMPAPERALPFRTLIQRLEIVRVIADTGSSLEYLAIDHASEAAVTLKEYMPARLARREGSAVRPKTAADRAEFALGLEAFVAEAKVLSRTHHPALARVTNVIEVNDTAYQVMPHQAGTRLLQVRQEMGGAPDEPALRGLLDDLLGALGALHNDGMLHGAVSPSNIMLLADDRPLLLGPELARAKIASDLVESLMAAVEPSFAAPEQRAPSATQPIGPWTDLYGLAETMRFCISGELPPPAVAPPGRGRRESMAQMVQRLFGDAAGAPYSTALLNTLALALETSPAARPQSVTEFRKALGAPPIVAAPTIDPRLRIEPGFDMGASVPPSAAAEPAAPRVKAPAARASTPHIAIRPAHTRRRALWAGSALVLLLGAGTYGWWRLDPAVQSDLTAAVTGPASATLPPAPPTPIIEAPQSQPEPQAQAQPTAPVAETPQASTPAASAAAPAVEPAAPPPEAALPAAPPQSTVTEAAATPPRPTKPKAAAATPATPASPRDACAGRTQFSLYRCMQTQCEQRGWVHHPQCERLRATDSVE